MILRLAAIFCLILTATVPAGAQRLVSLLSETQILIDSSFAGETLTLFGNVEPPPGENVAVEGPFNVVIIVRGPNVDSVTRRKNWTFGLWINTEEILFENVPSFYHVLASSPLEEVTNSESLDELSILPQSRAMAAAVPGQSNEEEFGRQMIRLLTERGLYGVDDRAVQFRSETVYYAQLDLPATVPDGNYLAETYLFKDGEAISRHTEAFRIRKTGFERFMGTAAIDYPLLYGLACVLLAVGTGWLGGVIFRR